MMRSILLIFLLPLLLLAHDDRPPIPYDFLAKPSVQRFISMMVTKHHFKRAYLRRTLQHAKLDRDTLDRYTGRYKIGSTNGSWERYKAHVLDATTLRKAKQFKHDYYTTLRRASREYHVDLDYIVGFICVESKFGEYSGDYSVLDALTTLAFHPNRMQRFFKSQLKHLFLMAREQGYTIERLKGSFAGAMGMVQQVPSVFRKYGMDYNHDGIKDPWSLEDSIGIIARFMHKNGWREGLPAAVTTNFHATRYRQSPKPSRKRRYPLSTLRRHGIKPTQPFTQSKAYLLKVRNTTHDDLYLGSSNFRVLTRYNNAATYGLAIHLIAQAVR